MAKDDGGKVPADALTKELVPDPADVPDLVSISGWIGKSGKAGHQRLYLNPNMSAWLEVPTASIKHWEKIGAQDSSFSGTMIWVARDEKLTLHRTTSSSAEGAYRVGRITGSRGGAPPYVVASPFPTTWDPNVCSTIHWPITLFTDVCSQLVSPVES